MTNLVVKTTETNQSYAQLLGISDSDAQLHEEILRIANHQTATRLIQRLRAQHVRFQYRTILVPGRTRQSLAEHGAIIAAIANHDEEAAEAVMRRHLAHVIAALHRSARKLV